MKMLRTRIGKNGMDYKDFTTHMVKTNSRRRTIKQTITRCNQRSGRRIAKSNQKS